MVCVRHVRDEVKMVFVCEARLARILGADMLCVCVCCDVLRSITLELFHVLWTLRCTIGCAFPGRQDPSMRLCSGCLMPRPVATS